MWPFSASSFTIRWIFWTSGCNKFPCHCFLVIAPWFRFRIPMIPDLYLSRQFSPLLQQPTAKVWIFQPSLRTRRCVGFWTSCHRVRFPCRCFEYLRAFRRNLLQALILPQSYLLLFCSCIFFAIVLVQLVKLKFWVRQRELKWLMLNKRRRLCHSSRVNFCNQ